ncbi:CDP-glucose 4,6-dehydratase [Yersinia enterocolitica]|uniref:CDP-glucose 4,6-dehydratase n=1 Tax=Yersinia enterocolitica TaxID=630 RepID=UPI0005DC0C75|nr:CDP-glucose 4,6-dehydratase [Yersinia enterocolitica]CNJ88943.1 CDP-glucose 4%2C6-dehydratase [Yersinia enterocolitica]CRY09095.1 CDP-glucose 4%2C6-dehydratase [Yersinia enterocolitica]HDL6508685.1 CDP-glucose 4,6-dehydratase [Yersinia enterocolitica]HDL8485531.1 CDP-glucose 4,6-dehydratase [Yersinia enterocolitica]
MFNNIYSGKKVMITGHTGFKGAWLTSWLLKLGAKVCGVSKEIPTEPSMFEELKLKEKIEHHFCDIRDFEEIKEIILGYKPDFLFHLAAQAIVSESYIDPLTTISTNVIGTANILESLRSLESNCIAIIITSDKCYENVEWVWGYKETDAVGGRDIYSGSKGAAEVIFHAYQQSFFKDKNSHIKLATGRAGNVIGGGDWAKDRIVVDCMNNWAKGQAVELRSPSATRPWQHVLEPLSGYLTLGASLYKNAEKLHGESFNFGPKAEQNRTVLELMSDLSRSWYIDDESKAYKITDDIPFHEAGLLKLNCDKALFHMKWEANLSYKECVAMVGEWYYSFYHKKMNMNELTISQIDHYETLAKSRGLVWTK